MITQQTKQTTLLNTKWLDWHRQHGLVDDDILKICGIRLMTLYRVVNSLPILNSTAIHIRARLVQQFGYKSGAHWLPIAVKEETIPKRKLDNFLL